MKFPIVDPVRTGQNIRTLRKNAGITSSHLQMAERRHTTYNRQFSGAVVRLWSKN